MSIRIVILAAGQGKRMASNLPKVLHRIAGKSMLEHVITTAKELDPDIQPIVIIGHQGDVIRMALAHEHIEWVEQKEQLGTGHAVMQALPLLQKGDRVLILAGDVPLISVNTLNQLMTTPNNAIGMITTHIPNPTGYGRIVRDEQQQVIAIVEEKDATEKERCINEINTGIYLIPAQYLQAWLPALQNHNAQKEYYLTDIITRAAKEKIAMHALQTETYEETLGVNDRAQLAHSERFYQRRLAEKFMQQGVTMVDPARFDVRGELHIGRDVIIDVNAIFEGRVVIGDHCVIGANSILRNTVLGHGVEVKANSMIDGAEIADGCVIGPFARIRPGTILMRDAHIGNFVEIKNSAIGANTKINHLSYIGDSEIGQRVNIGAGTITCNYDGVNKHKTLIGDDAFIGSDTQLVAPVSVGAGAKIGAGSTIVKDAPAQCLTLTQRLEQRSVEVKEKG